jgi:hypothetical protein
VDNFFGGRRLRRPLLCSASALLFPRAGANGPKKGAGKVRQTTDVIAIPWKMGVGRPDLLAVQV